MQGISTGIYHAALLSNQEACEKAFFEAGRASGDLVFPLPYTPELHFKEFHSEFADMKNSVMVRASVRPRPLPLVPRPLPPPESEQCAELLCRSVHRGSPGL